MRRGRGRDDSQGRRAAEQSTDAGAQGGDLAAGHSSRGNASRSHLAARAPGKFEGRLQTAPRIAFPAAAVCELLQLLIVIRIVTLKNSFEEHKQRMHEIESTCL